MRLIDANALKYKNLAEVNGRLTYVLTAEEIDNAPTVEPCSNCEDRRQAEYIRQSSSWYELQALRKFKAENERPQGKCKTCRYYHPYEEQFSIKPRGDGYCVIARMSPEGMTTINCNDEFGCSDYMKGGAE